jgi:hypothetical protein
MSILKALRGMMRGGGQAAARSMDNMPSQADLLMQDMAPQGMGGAMRGGMGGGMGGPTAIEDAAMSRQMRGERLSPMGDMQEAQQLRNALPQMQRELQMMMMQGGDPADIQALQQSIAEVRALLSRGGGPSY